MKTAVIALLLMGACVGAQAQTQGDVMVDFGMGVGVKQGVSGVVRPKCFVSDGWSVDVYGALGFFGIGAGLETSYFPAFADGWVYVDAGVSVVGPFRGFFDRNAYGLRL